jgi:hypothetical protein
MRGLAIALVVAGSVMAGCEETPKNAHAAACLKVLREERGVWIFGARAQPVAEAFCACVGEEVAKSKRLDDADRGKILAYLDAFEPTQDFVAIGTHYARFRDSMGDKYDGFKDALDRCLDRLAK